MIAMAEREILAGASRGRGGLGRGIVMAAWAHFPRTAARAALGPEWMGAARAASGTDCGRRPSTVAWIASAFAAVVPALLPSLATAWVTVAGGTPGDSRPFAIAADAANDVIVVGRATTPAAGDVAIAVAFAGGTGLELWRYVLDGSGAADDVFRAVAIDDATGAIIVAGRLANAVAADSGTDMVVAKLSPGGVEIWRRVLDGGGGAGDDAHAVALDDAGDVLVAGQSTPADGRLRATVVKLAGADGATLWWQDFDGTGSAGGAVARRIAVDTASDVVVAGRIRNATTGDDVLVAKLDGASGAVRWRTEITGDGDGSDPGDPGDPEDEENPSADDVGGLALVPLGGGDVVVAGRIVGLGTGSDFAVIAFSADGAERWRRVVDGTATGADDTDQARAVAVDANGDVIAAGQLADSERQEDFVVLELEGATGAERWRRDLDGARGGSDIARDLALVHTGDVIATGRLGGDGTRRDFAVARFAASDGAEQWRAMVDGSANRNDDGWVVNVDAAGDIVAAGRTMLQERDDRFTIVKRAGASGGDFPCGNAEVDPGEECDDGNATAGDGCRADCTAEVCGDGIVDPAETCDRGGAPSDGCCSPACAVAPNGTVCDDGNLCTITDRCAGGGCTPGAARACLPADVCQLAFCNPDTGGCASVARADGVPCSDGDPCTVGDACRQGTCSAGRPRECEDLDPCTRNACDPANGCVYPPHAGVQSVSCVFESGFVASACPPSSGAVPERLGARIARVERLLERAAAKEGTPAARRLLKRVGNEARKTGRLAARFAAAAKLEAGCASGLAVSLVEIASRADRARGAD
jgi:cysteine-rich repeat protein